jgi:tetratricopeptide (TPR) repeat protein
MRTSPLAAQAFRRLGGIFVSIGEYAEGASWLERFARERPTDGAAPDVLRDAVVLRLALGQAREAHAVADLFSKLYGSNKPADTAEIAFAVGAWYADHGDFKAAAQRLKASLPMIGKSASLDIHIQARAALARSLAAAGDARGAEEHFRAVQMIFKDPQAVVERILRQGPDLGDRRLGKALTALGEAHFFFAERERVKASAIKLPEYRGPADREALKKNLPLPGVAH